MGGVARGSLPVPGRVSEHEIAINASTYCEGATKTLGRHPHHIKQPRPGCEHVQEPARVRPDGVVVVADVVMAG